MMVDSIRYDCIYDLLSAQAVQLSDRPALDALGRSPLTYAGLFEQAQETIIWLNELGIGRNDRVAIVLPNGPEMATAFLSVASAAVSAPLNPAYNASEFAFYLADLQARALLILEGSTSPAVSVARELGISVLALRPRPESAAGRFDLGLEIPGEMPARDSANAPAKAADEALALHTSGTTSRPKLVPLSQQNICASARHILETLRLTESDRCLNVMPLFHIHGLMAAVLASLTAGASLVCTPGFDAARFFDWMKEFHPTWYTAVPTMHQAVLEQAGKNEAIIAAHPLRLIRSSSASLPPPVMAALEAQFKAPVIEAYGMTEAAHQMASNPLPPQPRKAGSVGKAAGPQVAIMDVQGALLSPENRGEIVIRGANVMLGYANNPTANQHAFTDGWFRTGDEGFFDPDGYLFITGRLKEMINRGGEKVTPREVDEVFLEHPAVALAVTFAAPHPTLGEDVVTAVTLKTKGVISEKDLRQFALERLAAFKAPSQVLIVEQIPKGPTGKLQRIGLYEKLKARLQPSYRPAQSQAEIALVGLWHEILNVAQPGVDDNFFALGGDSLKALQLLARINALFEIELPVGAIFSHPTIGEQALFIEELILQDIEAMDAQEADGEGSAANGGA
jgi:acyl-CoA synthetase (AMP-forming)/AMP-acid ligase II/acyl carrier protein